MFFRMDSQYVVANMTGRCDICGLMTRNLRAHLKINHKRKRASSGFIKSPAATAGPTEASPASASAPLVSPRLRVSYQQRIRERRERYERKSRERATTEEERRPKLTNNDSLNKSLLMLAEMIDEKETISLGQEIICGLSQEVKMYRQGYVKEFGQYTEKQYENCPVCFLHLQVFKCENKLYESYQVVTHIKKCQTLKLKSEIITEDNIMGQEQKFITDEKTNHDSEEYLSLSSNGYPMTSIYIKEEDVSIKEEPYTEEN